MRDIRAIKFMKKLITIITTMMLFVISSVPSFAIDTLDYDTKTAAAQTEITNSINDSKENLIKKVYPVGSIYTTTEDLSEDEVEAIFGGSWEQITDTFLYAKDADEEASDEEEPEIEETDIPPTAILGQKGGKRFYRFQATLGPDDDNELAFSSSSLSSYMQNRSPNHVFKGKTFEDSTYQTEGRFTGTIPVTEETSESEETEIMPPYTIVKMFERVR